MKSLKKTVQASVASNTFVVNGEAQDKDLSELIPDILPQMGAEALANIRKLAESFQAQQAAAGGAPAENKDEDVPDLVESFDQ
jgi:nascent polypeptide-associated complex subunit beta